MSFSLWSPESLLVCLVFFLAGIIDAVCGGGGLITIPTMMAVGLPTAMITGTNQCATILGSATAVARFAGKKKIRWLPAIAAIPFAVLGAFFGSRLNILLSERFLQLIMLAVTPVMAAVILLKKDFGRESRLSTLPPLRVYVSSMLIGLVLGCYQGFYGAGGGTLFLLALTFFLRMDMLEGTAAAKLIGFCASISATVTYALSGLVIWPLALAASVFNIAGSYLGASLAIRKGSRLIRPMLLAVLALLMLRVISNILQNGSV